jgi:tRNA (mo5U34)-methyltransferase
MLVCALFGGADLLISRLIDSRSRFVFLHIPKTAGSSIIAFFQDVFGRDAVWAHGQNFEISELTRDIPPHIRMICGHFRLSDVDWLLPSDFQYLSIVRDPIERITSYHEFVLATTGHPDQAHLPTSDINVNLEQSELFRSTMQDQQARFLSADGTAGSVRNLVERGMLSLATINEIGQFIREVCDRAGIPYSSGPGRENVSERMRPTLEAESDQLLEALTVQDRELYDYVSSSESRMESFGTESASSSGASAKIDKHELQRLVDALPWQHQIDFGDGVMSPGKATIDVLRGQAEVYFRGGVKGKSVLDIGCLDGFNSFEAYRLGARRVLATSWGRHAAFELARVYLAPGVEARDLDISDLTVASVGHFDIVLFCGVLYHLRHPFHTLEQISPLVRETLIVETHMDALGESRPSMIFYPNAELANDPTNWWGPNEACVTAMLNDVGFRRVEFTPHPRYPTRGIFHAHRS